ncbi:MAG: extracellular solute-binding protein [Bauldia sp.]
MTAPRTGTRNQFDAFTKATGISVQYVEAGSGGVVERIAKEASNPQADVLVTLPPFIQKAAADGLLQPYTPAGADQIAADQRTRAATTSRWSNNYMNFIYNSAALPEAPKTFNDLLDPKFKGKIQYSTPGQAGDGTAVMIELVMLTAARMRPSTSSRSSRTTTSARRPRPAS